MGGTLDTPSIKKCTPALSLRAGISADRPTQEAGEGGIRGVVLNTSDPGFDASLGDLCQRLGASIGFDAVAGEMSARVLRAQPRGSRLLVYGALSLEANRIDPASLIFEGKRVEGFWLTAWLRQRNILSQLRITRSVQQMLAGDLRTEIQARLPLKEAARSLEQYASNMTGGKILLLPNQETRVEVTRRGTT